MTIAALIAKQFRDVHFGGNWTYVNYRDTLADVTWQQAITKVQSFNTIATLVNHVSYYIAVVQRVLEGGPLEGKDELSFAHPPIENQEQWEAILTKFWSDAENYARILEQFPDSKLTETFCLEKLGTYFRNVQGMVEHHHYHLGQIVIIKKLLTT